MGTRNWFTSATTWLHPGFLFGLLSMSLDCSFFISLSVCCPCLWVVHSSFPSQFVVHVSGLFVLHFPLSLLTMSLGCSFFISLSVCCPCLGCSFFISLSVCCPCLWVVYSSFPSQFVVHVSGLFILHFPLSL